MENYLVDYEALARVIDALIAQKYPNEPTEKYKDLREASIKELDEIISQAVFASLSESETNELDQLLSKDDTSETVFQDFLKNTNLDFGKITEKAVTEYGAKFLEGVENA